MDYNILRPSILSSRKQKMSFSRSNFTIPVGQNSRFQSVKTKKRENRNESLAPSAGFEEKRISRLFLHFVQKFSGVDIALGGGLFQPLPRLGLVLFHAFAF